MTGLDPFSWTPDEFGERSPRKRVKPSHPQISETDGLLHLFQRDWSTRLLPGIGDSALAPFEGLVPVEGGAQYLVDLEFSGYGYVKVLLLWFDQHGQSMLREAVHVGDVVLTEKKPRQQFLRRFVAPPSARYLRLAVEHVGHSWLRIERANVDDLGSGDCG